LQLTYQLLDFSKPTSANFSAFGYHPSVANYIEAGKRPLSAISASIVTDNDGSLYFVVGAAGAARIVSATTQNLIWALDRNLSASDVLVKPRLHDQLVPNMTTFEWTYDNSTVDYLRQLGHITTWVPPLRSRAHCIRRLKDGTFEAAAEPRLKNSSGLTL
jgi:gamma-glutamyltranspeptidase/glutathione hydrolase